MILNETFVENTLPADFLWIIDELESECEFTDYKPFRLWRREMILNIVDHT